jgi:hypothetical protein
MRPVGFYCARARDSHWPGSLGELTYSKTVRDWRGGGSLSAFLGLLAYTPCAVFIRSPRLDRPAQALGARRSHPYSLYIVPHSLCHNAIDNAAAGVASPARVSYCDNAIPPSR